MGVSYSSRIPILKVAGGISHALRVCDAPWSRGCRLSPNYCAGRPLESRPVKPCVWWRGTRTPRCHALVLAPDLSRVSLGVLSSTLRPAEFALSGRCCGVRMSEDLSAPPVFVAGALLRCHGPFDVRRSHGVPGCGFGVASCIAWRLRCPEVNALLAIGVVQDVRGAKSFVEGAKG